MLALKVGGDFQFSDDFDKHFCACGRMVVKQIFMKRKQYWVVKTAFHDKATRNGSTFPPHHWSVAKMSFYIYATTTAGAFLRFRFNNNAEKDLSCQM